MPSSYPTSDRRGEVLSGLLRTIGLGLGPDLLSPQQASLMAGQAFEDAEDALACLPGMRAALLNPLLPTALDAVLGEGSALLSRADLVVLDKDSGWYCAGGRLTRHASRLRAVLGVSFLLPVVEGRVVISDADLALRPGQTGAVRLGTQYRLSEGIWLKFDFVRSWMKPDIVFIDALPTPDDWPQHVRRWLGAEISLPGSVTAFLDAEAAALRGDLNNVHGRGI